MAAQNAATETKNSISLINTVVDFTEAISLAEEIKRAHRNQQWSVLPDRYASLRKILIAVRASTSGLTERHRAAIQDAIINLQAMEKAVERGLSGTNQLSPARLNRLLSNHVDEMVQVLAELKASKVGV